MLNKVKQSVAQAYKGKAPKLASVLAVLTFFLAIAKQDQISARASSLTFTTGLAIVPLLAVGLSLFTAFPLFHVFSDALQAFLVNNLMPSDISDSIMQYLNEFALQASKLTAIGGLFLLLTSLLLVMAIDSALNKIWHVNRARPLAQRMIIYWAVISLGPILIGASLWTSAYFAHKSAGLLADMPDIVEFSLKCLPVVMTSLGFTLLFIIVPNRSVEVRDALVGGASTAVVLEVIKLALTYYVSQFSTYKVIYGAFSTVPVFLIWLYASWVAVLLGAMIAANLPLLRLGRLEVTQKPGAALLDAVQTLHLLADARGRAPSGHTVTEIIALTQIDYETLVTILPQLEELGYVARTNSSTKERWLLACDPVGAKLGPLFDRFAIDRQHFELATHPELLLALATLLAGTESPTLENVRSPHDKSKG
jgi:membrane protein